jgi:hypothetical protein
MITVPPGRVRVAELVQAQGYQPSRYHEDEDGQPVAPLGEVPGAQTIAAETAKQATMARKTGLGRTAAFARGRSLFSPYAASVISTHTIQPG